MQRAAIIGLPEKPTAQAILSRVRRWLDPRANVVFAELSSDFARIRSVRPDLLFALGGDGTLIAAAHHMALDQAPIVGVNLGKLGFLTEFTVEQLEEQGDFLFGSNLPVTRRVMLDVRLETASGQTHSTPAANDCVVFAGHPFAMMELTVDADDEEVANVRGDGLIVATASGSTAHNLSAGGPILEPTTEAFVVTPICPHTLSYRPLLLKSDRRIVVRVIKANEGTTVAVDGQVRWPFQPGDCLRIARYAADFLVVRNPRRSPWYALRKKLMWGQSPQNGQ